MKLPKNSGNYISQKITRSKKDFVITTYRGSGSGGMHRNSTETGVRIKDKITGLYSENCTERDKLQNHKKAFNNLINKLIDFYKNEWESKLIKEAHLPEIRVYSDKDGVKDHRTDKNYSYKDVLNKKGLDSIIKDNLCL